MLSRVAPLRSLPLRLTISSVGFRTSQSSNQVSELLNAEVSEQNPNTSESESSSQSSNQVSELLNAEVSEQNPNTSFSEFKMELDKLKKAKDYDGVVKFALKMELEGIRPDLVTLNILIDALSHLSANDMSLSFSIFGKIIKMGYIPSTVTLNTVIRGFCLKGLVDEALKFHDKILTVSQNECVFDNVTYGTLISGLCKIGNITSAVDLMNELPSHVTQDAFMFNSLIHGLCKQGDIADAVKYSKKMIRKNILPDLYTFNTLIFGTCSLSMFKKSFELFASMISEDVKPDSYTYNTIVGSLNKVGNIRESLAFVSMMIKQGVKVDVVTFNALLDGYFAVNEGKEAISLFYKMREWGASPTLYTYHILLNHLLRLKMSSDALAVFDDMGTNKLIHPTVLTYNILICGMVKVDRIEDAWKYFTEMHQKGISANTDTYNPLLDGLFKRFKFNKAMSLFRTIQERGIKLDAYTHTIYINGLCLNRRLDEARKFFYYLEGKGCLKVITCNVMITWLSRRRFFSEAFRLFQKMEQMGCTPNIITYTVLVRSLIKHGKHEYSDAVIHDMVVNDWESNMDAGVIGDGENIFRVFARGLIVEGVKVFLADAKPTVFIHGMEKTVTALVTETYVMSREVASLSEKLRTKDDIYATKLAFLRLESKVDEIMATLSNEEKVGAGIVRKAISYPLKVLSKGYNAETEKHEDATSAGILDPTKVVKCCRELKHAFSVAKTLLMSVSVEMKGSDF